jgi:acyl dehydratase
VTAYSKRVLAVGDSFERSFAITEEVVRAFSDVSLDRNAIHLSEAAGVAAGFRGAIAHGMLSAAFVSAVIGQDFPGAGTIYLGQQLSFNAPVPVPSVVLVRVTCSSVREDKPIATLKTCVYLADGCLVLDGEAVVRLPRHSEEPE